jgi:hypothetical protein
MTAQVADMDAHVQRLISVVTIGTIFEDYYRKATFCCVFLWAKGVNAVDIHKEVPPIYGGKCLSCKAVHNWVEKFSQGRYEVADDAPPGTDATETTAKRLIRCGFRLIGKGMVQVF